VTPAKLARLRRLAARWIGERGVRVAEVRFDLVGVRLDLSGDERFEHVRGVG
jgi:putative endonuclease